jgi:hypothetical protein
MLLFPLGGSQRSPKGFLAVPFTPTATTYDFDALTVALGAIIVDGFQDGEGVSIETGETFTDKVGIDGKVTRSKKFDRTATVTIKLMQSSASNDLLSELHILDRDAPNGAGVVPLVIRDSSGRSVYKADQAWVAQAPAVSFDQEAGAREWVIRCAKLVRIDGGN